MRALFRAVTCGLKRNLCSGTPGYSPPMSPRSRLIIAAFFALVASSSCNCGNARIVTAPDGGNPYERVAPASALAAGATVSQSQHFRLVGAVTAPAGTSSHSQNFQLKGGVVAASQE